MEDIEILTSALGIKLKSSDKPHLERCSNLKIFDFIKQCITTSQKVMSRTNSINTFGITQSLYGKLLFLNTEKSKRRLKCEICGKSHLETSKLKRHMLVHSKIKEFKCDTCGKQFSLGQHLKFHMRIHEGIKPYHCSFCNYSSSQMGGLRSHVKRKHPDKSIESI